MSNAQRGFIPLKEYDIADTQLAVIANSSAVQVGDALIPGATGHNKAVKGAAGTTGVIIGVCVAIEGLNGFVQELNSVTAGASNETTPVYYARYIPLTAPGIKFSGQLSNTAGTTTNSDGIGSFNVGGSNSGQLDETSIALFSATEKQFFSLGLDPTDNTNQTVIGSFAKTLTP